MAARSLVIDCQFRIDARICVIKRGGGRFASGFRYFLAFFFPLFLKHITCDYHDISSRLYGDCYATREYGGGLSFDDYRGD